MLSKLAGFFASFFEDEDDVEREVYEDAYRDGLVGNPYNNHYPTTHCLWEEYDEGWHDGVKERHS